MWVPKDEERDPGNWAFNVKRGEWVPPGQTTRSTGLLLELPPTFDPSQRLRPFRLVASPPGVPAPQGGLTYTPATGALHGPNEPEVADPGVMNVSVLPLDEGASGGPAPLGAGQDAAALPPAATAAPPPVALAQAAQQAMVPPPTLAEINAALIANALQVIAGEDSSLPPADTGQTPLGVGQAAPEGTLTAGELYGILARELGITGQEAHLMVAAALTEAPGRSPGTIDTRAIGDNGLSVGPWQMHAEGMGRGMTHAERMDVVTAARRMYPEFRRGLQAGEQRGLRGTDLMRHAYLAAERPDDRQGVAARRFLDTFARTPAPGDDYAASQMQPLGASQPTTRPRPQPGVDQNRLGLDRRTAESICGPAAVQWFLQHIGRTPTIDEALNVAKREGWTSEHGMAGPESTARTIRALGGQVVLAPADPARIAREVEAGRPVIINTRGHYYQVTDHQDGKFQFGDSVGARAGWITLDQLGSLGYGAATEALYLPADVMTHVRPGTEPNFGLPSLPPVQPWVSPRLTQSTRSALGRTWEIDARGNRVREITQDVLATPEDQAAAATEPPPEMTPEPIGAPPRGGLGRVVMGDSVMRLLGQAPEAPIPADELPIGAPPPDPRGATIGPPPPGLQPRAPTMPYGPRGRALDTPLSSAPQHSESIAAAMGRVGSAIGAIPWGQLLPSAQPRTAPREDIRGTRPPSLTPNGPSGAGVAPPAAPPTAANNAPPAQPSLPLLPPPALPHLPPPRGAAHRAATTATEEPAPTAPSPAGVVWDDAGVHGVTGERMVRARVWQPPQVNPLDNTLMPGSWRDLGVYTESQAARFTGYNPSSQTSPMTFEPARASATSQERGRAAEINYASARAREAARAQEQQVRQGENIRVGSESFTTRGAGGIITWRDPATGFLHQFDPTTGHQRQDYAQAPQNRQIGNTRLMGIYGPEGLSNIAPMPADSRFISHQNASFYDTVTADGQPISALAAGSPVPSFTVDNEVLSPTPWGVERLASVGPRQQNLTFYADEWGSRLAVDPNTGERYLIQQATQPRYVRAGRRTLAVAPPQYAPYQGPVRQWQPAPMATFPSSWGAIQGAMNPQIPHPNVNAALLGGVGGSGGGYAAPSAPSGDVGWAPPPTQSDQPFWLQPLPMGGWAEEDTPDEEDY